MDGLKTLVPLLPMVLPLLGKLLLMAPFIPNKAIPFINGLVASIAKYWFLAGFGTLGAEPVPVPGTDVGLTGDTVLMAGFFGDLGRTALSVAWGSLDSFMSHTFYEHGRAKAIINKTGPTWLERGKRSIF